MRLVARLRWRRMPPENRERGSAGGFGQMELLKQIVCGAVAASMTAPVAGRRATGSRARSGPRPPMRTGRSHRSAVGRRGAESGRRSRRSWLHRHQSVAMWQASAALRSFRRRWGRGFRNLARGNGEVDAINRTVRAEGLNQTVGVDREVRRLGGSTTSGSLGTGAATLGSGRLFTRTVRVGGGPAVLGQEGPGVGHDPAWVDPSVPAGASSARTR